MGRGTSKVGGSVSPIIQEELNRFNGKTGTTVTYMIERSKYGIPYDDVKNSLRKDIEQSDKKGVEVDYYSLKSNIDNNGYADVEVAYKTTISRYTGSHDLGTGMANVKTTTERKYKTVRVKLMDFKK